MKKLFMLSALLLVSGVSTFMAAAREDYTYVTIMKQNTPLVVRSDGHKDVAVFRRDFFKLTASITMEMNAAYRGSARLFNSDENGLLTIGFVQLQAWISVGDPPAIELKSYGDIGENLKPDVSAADSEVLKYETIRIGEAKRKKLASLIRNCPIALDRTLPVGTVVLDVAFTTIAKKILER